MVATSMGFSPDGFSDPMDLDPMDSRDPMDSSQTATRWISQRPDLSDRCEHSGCESSGVKVQA